MSLLEDIKYQKDTMKCNCRLLCSAEIATKRIKELEAELKQYKSMAAKAYTACGNYQQRIKGLETALKSIWPFIEEDFPKGTSDNHGTCATDSYVLAARKLEQVLKG